MEVQINNTKVSLCPGRKSCLEDMKDALFTWLSNMRDEGILVSIHMIVLYCGTLVEGFVEKKEMSKCQIVKRLMKENGWSIPWKTREAQTAPKLSVDKAAEFVSSVQPFLSMPMIHNHNWIMNIDQTAVFCPMAPHMTVHNASAQTVAVRQNVNACVLFTVAIFVTAAGTKLKPMTILKGKHQLHSTLYFCISYSNHFHHCKYTFVSIRATSRLYLMLIQTLSQCSILCCTGKWLDG